MVLGSEWVDADVGSAVVHMGGVWHSVDRQVGCECLLIQAASFWIALHRKLGHDRLEYELNCLDRFASTGRCHV